MEKAKFDKDRELAELLASDSFRDMQSQSQVEDDYAFAQMLESQYADEIAHDEVASFIPKEFVSGSPSTKKRTKSQASSCDKLKGMSIIAPEWEDIDPTPDLHALFLQYNERFFWGKLAGCEVKWSPRMTLCAGVCSYQGRGGLCSIRLSVPLLKLRPRKDLVETLLHEMIHAYLFVTDGNDDHDGHGPAFHEHMYRINKETGTKISVYHNFHDEVALYKQHWWKCNGPCVKMKPFYGLVKRSMNRAPGPYDTWWKQHQATCGGTYTKIKEPEGYGKKLTKKDAQKGQTDIRAFGKANASGTTNVNNQNNLPTNGGGKGNIFGFGGSSFKSPVGGGLQTKGRSGTHTVNPGWKHKDNSSIGHVITSGDDASHSKINKKDIINKPADLNLKTSTSNKDVKKVNLDDNSEKVRQNVRDFWAKRQPTDNEVPSIIAKSSKEQQATSRDIQPKQENKDILSAFKKSEGGIEQNNTTPKYVKCPICDKDVIEMNMNSHLDECLNTSLIKDIKQSVKSKEVNDYKGSSIPDHNNRKNNNSNTTNDNVQACPICGKDILHAELEFHVNMCLDK